jgi:hypothetical protein
MTTVATQEEFDDALATGANKITIRSNSEQQFIIGSTNNSHVTISGETVVRHCCRANNRRC